MKEGVGQFTKIENRFQVWNMCCTKDYSISWCSYMDKCSWSPEIACWTNFPGLWKLQGLKLCSSQQQGSIVRDPVTIDFETRKHAAQLENEWSFENSFEKAAPQMDFWTCGHWTIIWRACCQKSQHHIYKHLTKSLEGQLWSWWGELWKLEKFGGEKDGEKTLHANNKEKTCFGQVWK